MRKIQRVGALDGDMLDIELDNGHTVLLSLTSLLNKPDFIAIREDGRICYPQTDKYSVFWQEGPRITLDEIFILMQKDIEVASK